MFRPILACLALAAAIWPSLVHAQSDLVGEQAWDVHFDARASVVGGETSWLDGGFGKLRYGGDDGDTQARLRPVSIDVAWKPRFGWNLTGLVSVTHQDGQSNEIDISEAYLEYRSDPAPTRFAIRAGAMWPPVSEEHGGSNWTVQDSITPSAVNSWIGEEVKVLALEASVKRNFGEHELKLTAAVFKHNDLSGTLLFYRGWSLNDFRVTLDSYHPLPPLAPAAQGKQDTITNSFWELDGRAGYYGRIDYTPPLPVTFNLFRYDNLGDHVSGHDMQIQWRTRFWNLGAAARLGERTTAKAQVMWGDTLAGPQMPQGIPGDMNYVAAYLLLSREIGQGKLTLRGDWFETTDNSFVEANNNNENGWAAMAAYKHPIADHVEGIVELLHVSSYRDGRELYGGIDERQAQTLLQASLRFDL